MDSDQEKLPDTPEDPETLKLAYQDALSGLATLDRWFDHLDAKLVAVFTMASAVIGLSPAISGSPTGRNLWIWLIASAFWLYAMFHCFQGFRGRAFEILSSKQLNDSRWLGLSRSWYLKYGIERLAEAWEANRAVYKVKADHLRYAKIGMAAEVLAVVIAVLAR